MAFRGRPNKNSYNSAHSMQEGQRAQIPAQTNQMETAGAAVNMGGEEQAHSVNHEGSAVPGLSGEQYQELSFASNLKSPTKHLLGIKLLSDDTTWILDTGASRHMTENWHLLQKRKKLTKPILITLPDGKVVWDSSKGQVRL